jgi:hypothetical protein
VKGGAAPDNELTPEALANMRRKFAEIILNELQARSTPRFATMRGQDSEGTQGSRRESFATTRGVPVIHNLNDYE